MLRLLAFSLFACFLLVSVSLVFDHAQERIAVEAVDGGRYHDGASIFDAPFVQLAQVNPQPGIPAHVDLSEPKGPLVELLLRILPESFAGIVLAAMVLLRAIFQFVRTSDDVKELPGWLRILSQFIPGGATEGASLPKAAK